MSSAYDPLIDHFERALALPVDTAPAKKLDALEYLVVTAHRLSMQHAQLLANLLSIPSGNPYGVSCAAECQAAAIYWP